MTPSSFFTTTLLLTLLLHTSYSQPLCTTTTTITTTSPSESSTEFIVTYSQGLEGLERACGEGIKEIERVQEGKGYWRVQIRHTNTIE